MMGTTTATDGLVSIRERLLRLLAELDDSGEHIAAAHLVAAIDALEDHLEAAQIARPEIVPERPLDVITKAIVRRYGDQAEAVARRQLSAARGEAIVAWARIVQRIDTATA